MFNKNYLNHDLELSCREEIVKFNKNWEIINIYDDAINRCKKCNKFIMYFYANYDRYVNYDRYWTFSNNKNSSGKYLHLTCEEEIIKNIIE